MEIIKMINHNFSNFVSCESCSSRIEFPYPILHGNFTCSECNKLWHDNGSKMVKCNCEESCTEYLRG